MAAPSPCTNLSTTTPTLPSSPPRGRWCSDASRPLIRATSLLGVGDRHDASEVPAERLDCPLMHPGEWAEKTPDKPAVIMHESGVVVTYRELEDRSRRLAQLWWSKGLRPGDHVALFME